MYSDERRSRSKETCETKFVGSKISCPPPVRWQLTSFPGSAEQWRQQVFLLYNGYCQIVHQIMCCSSSQLSSATEKQTKMECQKVLFRKNEPQNLWKHTNAFLTFLYFCAFAPHLFACHWQLHWERFQFLMTKIIFIKFNICKKNIPEHLFFKHSQRKPVLPLGYEFHCNTRCGC